MDNAWAPSVGDSVYIEQERQTGQVIDIEITDGAVLYIVEVQGDAGPGGRVSGWGYDSADKLVCTIDELTAD